VDHHLAAVSHTNGAHPPAQEHVQPPRWSAGPPDDRAGSARANNPSVAQERPSGGRYAPEEGHGVEVGRVHGRS
jgi:hypothetical protein